MSKKIFTILLAVLLTVAIFMPQQVSAQTPEKMSYQAVVRDASNNLVTTQAVGMQISILLGTVGGTAVYAEKQTPITNANGLVTLEIGTGTIISGDFTTIDWGSDVFFIKTETDPTGGVNYTITGTSQLLSVPYALHAKTADSLTGTITEIDPDFAASVANGITATDTINWNNKLDSYTETDPDFAISIASGIIATDTTNWNNKLDSYTETQNLADVTALNDSVNSRLVNVTDPLDAQDAATKAYVDLLEARIYALENPPITLTDIDGNTYQAIEIGTQIWMAENLKTTRYPNGDTIPLVTGNITWGNLANTDTADAYCWRYDNIANKNVHGAFYTYAAAIGDNWTRDNVINQGVCPNGWHLPTDTEWGTLETYLGTNAGSKLAGNALLWNNGVLEQNPNFDSSDFVALPSGLRNNSTFYNGGNNGLWWSATDTSYIYAYTRYLYYNSTDVNRYFYYKSYGLSVRCVRD